MTTCLSRLYSTSDLWCIINRALLTWHWPKHSLEIDLINLIKTELSASLLFGFAYNRLIHSHSREIINKPPFWHMASDSHSSLYMCFRLLFHSLWETCQVSQQRGNFKPEGKGLKLPESRLQSLVLSSNVHWFQTVQHPLWKH